MSQKEAIQVKICALWLRYTCRWEDNIKMDLQEVRCEGMDWIVLAQGTDKWRALVNAVMKLQVP
jgi:hypothetical protein